MKAIKPVLLAGFLLVPWLIVPSLHAQPFTFITIAGGISGAMDGTNSNAQFSKPTGVTVDGSGNIYVADYLNNTIRKITPLGTNWIVTTIAGGTSGDLDGANSNAQFSGPTGITLDSATNLYVSDQLNYTIRKITPSGTNWIVTTIAGQARVSGALDGTNADARFYNPTGVAVDSAGNIFVADEFNNAIRKISPAGTNWIVSTIAGGSMGAADGTNSAAQFFDPSGVAVDTNGRVFVADQINNTIRLITPMGTNWVVTTIAGQSVSGLSNGLGTNALFDAPLSVTLDTNNNIYVGDSFNNAIRILAPSATNWMVSTIAGGSRGTDDGIGTNARFYLPFGMAADIYGDVFVADSENNTIRLGISSSGAPQTGSLQVMLTPSNAVAAGVEWRLDGGPFQASGGMLSDLAPGTYTISFSTNAGYATPDDQTITVTAHLATTVTVNYAYVQTYTITLSVSSDNGGTVSGGGIFPPGSSNTVTATPNNGFEFIGWTGDATGTNNPLTVTVNTSLNLTAYFAPSGSITLTIVTNGNGTVSPNMTGKNLTTNRSYTLIATAKSGNVFSNWTETITTNKNPLTLKVKSSMVLQANFITNPFPPVKGTYNGFFSTTNGVTEGTAGMLKNLIVRQNGTCSGTLLANGGSHGISGTFSLGGIAANKIARPVGQGGPLLVEMTLDWNVSPPQVTGMVYGTNGAIPWVADLTACLATNTLSSSEYTMLIPPDASNSPPVNSPGGDSYALITNHSGTARITGALADGTVLNQTAPVSQGSYVPIYANLYANKGLLLGWINLDITNTAGVNLTWIHPARAAGLYTNGFTNVLRTNQILLSPWTNSPGELALLATLSLLDIMNDTNALSNFAMAISPTGEIGPAPLSGSVNLKTGLFKVTVGSGAGRTNGYGAILPNVTNGGGYFLTKTNAQAMRVGP